MLLELPAVHKCSASGAHEVSNYLNTTWQSSMWHPLLRGHRPSNAVLTCSMSNI